MIRATTFLLAMLTAFSAEAQEREWILDAQEEDAFLLFGVPDTDDVALSFWCNVGSGKLKLFVPEAGTELEPETQTPLRIMIGDKGHDFLGTVTQNEEASTKSVETELTTDHAVIGELKTADRFSVVTGKHTLTVPLAEANIEVLLKLCMAK